MNRHKGISVKEAMVQIRMPKENRSPKPALIT
jgi:hypothetical protein